jgi:hypothetical protein
VLAGTIGLVIVWELTEASFGIQTAGNLPIIQISNMDGAWGRQLPMISWLNGCDRRERPKIAMQQSNEVMRSGIKSPGAKVVNGHLSARWLMKIACRREDYG